MPLVLDATVAGANSNSYLTVTEATSYFESRAPQLNPAWDSLDPQDAYLVTATRLIDSLFRPLRVFVADGSGGKGYYRVRRQWSGTPATTTQRLAWPRIGMFDANGNAIASNVIPLDLKYAVAELAGQLGKADRTLDNDVLVQGISSVSAGSVSVSFKDSIFKQTLPDLVLDLLIPSWITDELIESVLGAEVELL